MEAETYPFSALLGRMKYITRWSLMRNGRPESLSEHTADTALIAHMLCLIARHCTGTGAGIRPDTAERLSALIKCMEECQAGNREFAAALEQQREAIAKMQCPEADFFIEHMLPCYTQNLDELTRGRF